MKQTPGELFTWVKIYPGDAAKFPLDFCESDVVLIIPGHGRAPEHYKAGDFIFVPHYEIAGEDDEAQGAINKMIASFHDEAWRLLQAAAGLNKKVFGFTLKEVEQLMKARFAAVFGVDEKRVEIESCLLDNKVVGIYKQRKDNLVVTIHIEPTLMHTPHLKPTCFMDCGFAVLDSRVVLGGEIWR